MQKKTFEIYQLLFLIMKQGDPSLICGSTHTPNKSETITMHGSWSIVWKNLIYWLARQF